MFNYTTFDQSKVDFIEIGPADLPNGERLFVEIEDKPIVIFNIAGQYFAIGDGDLEDHTVVCPRHGGEFDVRTGKATMLPAVEDIPAYPVRIVNGNIELGIPKK